MRGKGRKVFSQMEKDRKRTGVKGALDGFLSSYSLEMFCGSCTFMVNTHTHLELLMAFLV